MEASTKAEKRVSTKTKRSQVEESITEEPSEDIEPNTTSASSTENEAKQEEHHSLLQVVRLWTDGTSTHGVRYAFDPNFFPWKHIVWSAFVTCMATIMVLAVIAVLDQYLAYQTKTSTYTSSPDRLPFPQVIVCNANPYQQSLREKHNITWPRNDEEVNLISQPLENFILDTQFNNFSNYQYLKEREVTPKLRDLWRPVITPNGRCWSFVTNSTVGVPGQNGGLSFIVNIQQDEYIPEAIISGILFSVAEPGTVLVDQDTLNTIPPGGAADVFFLSHEISREKRDPWSTCNLEAPEYTQARCRAECVNRATAESCNCRPLGDVQPELQHLDYCRPDDSCKIRFNYGECNCSKPPCHEFRFSLKSTTAPMAINFQKRLESTFNVTALEENVALVTINYETIAKNVIEETRVQGPYELMAAIGGVTGLYMGVSLISLLEIFGELLGLRLIPRLWGDSRLYGIGGRS